MRGIPADVMQAARMIAAERNPDDIVSAIAHGIMAERKRCMEITATSMKRVCAEMDEHIAKANGDRSTVHASILVGYTFAGYEARTIADAIERGDQP